MLVLVGRAEAARSLQADLMRLPSMRAVWEINVQLPFMAARPRSDGCDSKLPIAGRWMEPCWIRWAPQQGTCRLARCSYYSEGCSGVASLVQSYNLNERCHNHATTWES